MWNDYRFVLIYLCITSPQVYSVNFRLLQSSKLAASEFGFNRAAAANEGEETNVADNDVDDDVGDEDDDEKAERNVDYEGDDDEKADLSDVAESGV